ncbi:uncharacterized protein [Cicer arietinum]|uniref:Large ribosomal subunit protein uL23m n=1 Tax=Cicer arietinum TaxID=3827 RepID=A0A1S3E7S2_CICAR|nr:uncharacterized protein LOC101493331 [Cicer arietinum]
MGSRLGRRVVHFANLPIKLLMPTTFTNIHEIALKTIPSASKIEIKRVLESLYGFEVEKVRTLNMDGKKKKRGGIVFAKPDYKKAYVTLKNPLSIDPNLYPIRIIEEEKKNMNKQAKSSVVEEAPNKTHWLDDNKEDKRFKSPNGSNRGGSGYVSRFPWINVKSGWSDATGSNRSDAGNAAKFGRRNATGSNRSDAGNAAKFPWTNMRSVRGNATR